MTALLVWLTLILAAVIVLVVAYHLAGIFLALRKTAAGLASLAEGLVKIRDDTAPLDGQLEAINGGLSTLLSRLLEVNGDLQTIVTVARRQ